MSWLARAYDDPDRFDDPEFQAYLDDMADRERDERRLEDFDRRRPQGFRQAIEREVL